jgi:hypothetical protein
MTLAKGAVYIYNLASVLLNLEIQLSHSSGGHLEWKRLECLTLRNVKEKGRQYKRRLVYGRPQLTCAVVLEHQISKR